MDISSGTRRDEVVSRIYEAAAGPAGWADALDALMNEVAGDQIMLARFDADAHAHLAVAGQTDEAAMAICREHYNDNVWSAHGMAAPFGEAASLDSAVPFADLRKTAFYADVLRPPGIRHGMFIKIAGEDDQFFALMVGRGRGGAFLPAELGELNSYGAHIERAWSLERRFAGLAFVHDAELDMLDALGVGAVLLDARGRIALANRAATALDRSAIELAGRHLRCMDAAMAGAFDAAVGDALGGLSPRPVPFRGAAGGLLTMVASPLGRRVRQTLEQTGAGRPAAMVSIYGLADDAPAMSAFEDAFGLTRTEARVAAALALGDGDVETARRLGIGVNSLKTHRRRIFEKVGVNRQAQFARLAARLPGRG